MQLLNTNFMMDPILQVISVGIVATIAMTLFSYLFSYLANDNYKEPQLLNYLIDTLPSVKASICREHILGWTIHFSIGILFVAVYQILETLAVLDFSIISASIFGFIAGLVGIVGWSIGFAVHPSPPKINKLLFFLQLIIAHIIFGGTMGWLLM